MVSGRTVILDCGASRTALGVFSRQRGRLLLEQYALENHAPGDGSAGSWLENTGAALQTLRRTVIHDGPVVLVLPAHLILTRLIRTPRVSAARREKIIRFEAGQHIPSALEEVVWDSIVSGEDGLETEVLLAAVKLPAVESLCAAATAAGFDPSVVLPSPLATLAGFRLAHGLTPEPSLVLKLGVHSATLLLAGPKRFGVRSFPVMSHGSNSVAGPLEPTVARLVHEAMRLVAQFRPPDVGPTPTKMYVTGGATSLSGLDEALSAKLNLVVKPLDISVAIDDARGETSQGLPEPALVDLAGAAATQLLALQPVLNLLPSRRRQRVDFRQRLPLLFAAGLLALATLMPALVYFHRLGKEAREKSAAIEQELAPWRAREARNRANLQEIKLLREQIAQLDNIAVRRTGWLDLLADVQDRLLRVDDVWLDRLQVVSNSAGPTKRLHLSGRMLDRANPLARVGSETSARVRTMLAGVADSPFVAEIEAERFDHSQPGILGFDFVLVTNPEHPL